MAAIVTTLRRRKERLRSESALLSNLPSLSEPQLQTYTSDFGAPPNRFFDFDTEPGHAPSKPVAGGLLSKIRLLQNTTVPPTAREQSSHRLPIHMNPESRKQTDAALRVQRVFRGYQLRKIVIAIHTDAFSLSQSSVRTVVGMIRSNVKGWDLLCLHILFVLLFVLMTQAQLSLREPHAFTTHSALRKAFQDATLHDGGGFQDVHSPADALELLGEQVRHTYGRQMHEKPK
jgi:hypothetical protein